MKPPIPEGHWRRSLRLWLKAAAALAPGRSARATAMGILLAPLLSLPALAGGGTTIDVAINGMVCSFCAQGIERKLRSLPATESVKVNLDQKLVSITVRPGGSISNDQLQRLIRDSGFDVRQIQRSPASP